jgi:hypothetical protein
MAPGSRSRRILALAALLAIVLGAWLGRGRLQQWTHARLAAEQQRQLAQLSDEGAAVLIARLAEADDEYLDLIVLALAEPRPAVADAAQEALIERMARWSQWRAEESAPRACALAGLLAESAERIPDERRPLLHSLAQRLLLWPVDGRSVDSEKLIADCERLLRLPLPAMADLRVAAVSLDEGPAVQLDISTQAIAVPRAATLTELPISPPAGAPRIVHPEQPAALPDASREKPSEPRQFIAPKAIRISDE